SGELPPGQYYVTVEYRNFVGQSQVPPYWQEKSASQPSTQAIFSKEDTKQGTSLSSTFKKPDASPSIPRLGDPNEQSIPSPSSEISNSSTQGTFYPPKG